MSASALNCLVIFAIIGAIVGAIAVVRYGRRFLQTSEGKRLIARISGMKVSTIDETQLKPTDRLPSDASPADMLGVVEPGQVVAYATDFGGTDHQVQASMTLQPHTQETSGAKRWVAKKEKPSKAILVGGKWIFHVPSSEKGKPVWMIGELLDVTAPALAEFYKGTETDPGPAKEFKRLKQNLEAPAVIYKLPKRLTPNTTWRVLDIGAFKIQVQGNADGIAENGDFVYFVTSRESGGEDWLFFLDARDEAVGIGGLFRCRPFNPSTEIKSLF